MNSLISLTGIAFALFIVELAERWSNDSFLMWKEMAVRQSTWTEMVVELRALEFNKKEGSNSIIMQPTEMPKSFGALGLSCDFMGFTPDQFEGNPMVMYGVKARRWGLIIGSNAFSYGEWNRFKRVQIAKDVWLFAGSL